MPVRRSTAAVLCGLLAVALADGGPLQGTSGCQPGLESVWCPDQLTVTTTSRLPYDCQDAADCLSTTFPSVLERPVDDGAATYCKERIAWCEKHGGLQTTSTASSTTIFPTPANTMTLGPVGERDAGDLHLDPSATKVIDSTLAEVKAKFPDSIVTKVEWEADEGQFVKVGVFTSSGMEKQVKSMVTAEMLEVAHRQLQPILTQVKAKFPGSSVMEIRWEADETHFIQVQILTSSGTTKKVRVPITNGMPLAKAPPSIAVVADDDKVHLCYNHEDMSWTEEKRAWCCKYLQVGCPYECHFGTAGLWPPEKREWCCKEQMRGCPSRDLRPSAKVKAIPIPTLSGPVAPTPTMSGPVATTSCPFRCKEAFANWQMEWSAAKKAWCCRNEGLGCSSGQTTTPSPFHCSVALDTWERSWSEEKKAWCCEHEAQGCPDGSQDLVKSVEQLSALQSPMLPQTPAAAAPQPPQTSALLAAAALGCLTGAVPHLLWRRHRGSAGLDEEGGLGMPDLRLSGDPMAQHQWSW